jgi:hypothetical protein
LSTKLYSHKLAQTALKPLLVLGHR